MNEVLYVPQLAKRIGKTEAAIRSGHQRGVEWLPPAYRMGRRLAWNSTDVDAFLSKRAKKGTA